MRYGVPSGPLVRAIPSMCLQSVGFGVPLVENASASALFDNALNAPTTPPADSGCAGTKRCPIDSGVSAAVCDTVPVAEPPASNATAAATAIASAFPMVPALAVIVIFPSVFVGDLVSAPGRDDLEVRRGDGDGVGAESVVSVRQPAEVALERLAPAGVERLEGLQRRAVPPAEERDELSGRREPERERPLGRPQRRHVVAEEAAEVALRSPEHRRAYACRR